ncbi:MAG: hypothetical protein ACFFD4_23565, partial [Candidatus Odinarchaeota archaeon]
IDLILDKELNPGELVSFIENQRPLTAVITASIINDFESDMQTISTPEDGFNKQFLMEVQKKTEEPKYLPLDDEIKRPLVLKELLTVAPILKTKGKVLDFINHYTDRYSKIVDIFIENNKNSLSTKQTPLITDFDQLARFTKSTEQTGDKTFDVVVIGVVSEVQLSHESIKVYLQGSGKPPLIVGKFRKNAAGAKSVTELPLGVVIGIKGTPIPQQQEIFPILEAEAIVYPDIATAKMSYQPPPSGIDPLIIAVSDLRYKHPYVSDIDEKSLDVIKSKDSLFLDALITSINRTITSSNFGRISAVIFSGNTIDSTNSKLSIKDHYASLIKRLSKLDPSITIILTPGETDFTREFLPQPRPHEKYLPKLPPNISFLDNPACFLLNGRTILVFHDKNASKVLKQDEEIDFMVKLLRFRYLAPKWQNTSSVVLPAPHDPLVITHEPDIFILSSVNNATTGRYKNVRLVTATNLKDYQERLTGEERFTSGLLEIDLPATSLNTLESRVINLLLTKKI